MKDLSISSNLFEIKEKAATMKTGQKKAGVACSSFHPPRSKGLSGSQCLRFKSREMRE
jgi:hypothetical protein